MKSGRYEILPRLRKTRQTVEGAPLWKCTWRDPGNLAQRKGHPLRYTLEFVGIGITPDEAIHDCRHQYAKYLLARDNTWKQIDKMINLGMGDGPDISLGPSDKYLATSNLPWWKRLFRA